ncbi:flagellar motor protein MotB [Pseudogracilibacillus sp. ICA-222130]|uniref:flagellar motor protein MotB n=1 Tax=Pseudogracilibacillus sp. ICA-222130 TaxID=3134655 RepID=UPI0030C5BD01
MKWKRKDKREEKMDESWLLPYADMLTLLLALFIVLFAMSEVDAKKFKQLASFFESEFTSGEGIVDHNTSIISEKESKEEKEVAREEDANTSEQKAEYEYLRDIQQHMDAYIKDNDLIDVIGTKLTAEGLYITIRTDITFDSGSAQVKSSGKKIAKEISPILDTEPPHEIVINGHADDRPMHNEQFASNWELSSMRAIQFMYLLLEETEMDPKYFSARGYGEHQPIVPNTSEENRAQNRRVELLIEPNYTLDESWMDEVE